MKQEKTKGFFSSEKFEEIMPLLVFEGLLILLLVVLMYRNNLTMPWSTSSFVLSLVVWGLSSVVDPERYFNLASLLGLIPFFYLLWWMAFHVIPIL
jgi:hypothetical protein